MRGVLGVAALVAGCSESGVFIEVRVDGPATRVELFIGLESCDDCLTLTPESSRVPVPGRVLYRDSDAPLTALVDADGSAWFKLATSPETQAGIVAIATTDDTPGKPVAVAIVDALDLSLDRHVILETDPTAEWATNAATQPPYGALLWPDEQCVGATDDAGQTTFIVTSGDPDCDAVEPRLECDKLTYLATQSAEDTSCAGPATLPSIGFPGEFCVLGHSNTGCIDGAEPSPECSQDGPIVGPRVCECDREDLFPCVREENALRIECSFMATTAMDGSFAACGANSTSARPAILANAAGLDTCITFAGFSRIFSFPPTQDMFQEIFRPYPNGPHAKLSIFPELLPDPGACIAGLQWSFAVTGQETPDSAQFFAWIQSDLVEKPFLVPMKIAWEKESMDCGLPSTCTLLGDPRIMP